MTNTTWEKSANRIAQNQCHSLRTWYWFVLCNLQIFSGCVCHLQQLHAHSPCLFPIVFSMNLNAEVIFRPSRLVSCKNQENGSGKQWSLHTPLLIKRNSRLPAGLRINFADCRYVFLQKCKPQKLSIHNQKKTFYTKLHACLIYLDNLSAVNTLATSYS